MNVKIVNLIKFYFKCFDFNQFCVNTNKIEQIKQKKYINFKELCQLKYTFNILSLLAIRPQNRNVDIIFRITKTKSKQNKGRILNINNFQVIRGKSRST